VALAQSDCVAWDAATPTAASRHVLSKVLAAKTREAFNSSMETETEAVAWVEAILNRVYSPYMHATVGSAGAEWRPRTFFSAKQRRYLWSDAFGVCSLLSLHHATKQRKFLVQAEALARDVHADLGFRRGSTRKRLSAQASAAAPLLGGLRIGKPQAHEDGQYFHYLTKWMFALLRLSAASGDARYLEWAVQLAAVAHRRFVLRDADGEPARMVWKRSTDLEHVMVSGEGTLDPFDGLVTFRLLQRASAEVGGSGYRPVLEREIADMQRLVDRRATALTMSDDALDLGQALWLASWFPDENWARRLASVSLAGLEKLAPHVFPTTALAVGDEHHTGFRLLFREMGAALGLQVAVIMDVEDGKAALPTVTQERREQWAVRVQRLLALWRHRLFDRDQDISPLMYAAALLPGVWSPSYAP
jgi:hypothetical protein